MSTEAEQGVHSAVLDEPSRQASIRGSLRLLASWFAEAGTWRLEPEAVVASRAELDVELAKAVRLRVLLALAAEAEQIVEPILQHPSFRYRQVAEEMTGCVAGALDVPRYVRDRGQRASPRRYPVRVVVRDVRTPENVLLAAGLVGLQGTLAAVASDLPLSATGPERRAIEAWRARLRRILGTQVMHKLTQAAKAHRGTTALRVLRSQVGRRIQRGDIAQPHAYVRLSAWVDRLLDGHAPETGKVPWALYDKRFDSRLFELWTLATVTDVVTASLGTPPSGGLRPLWERGRGPIARWATPLGGVELYFQREAARIGLPGRWRVPPNDRVLRALPDLVLVVQPLVGPQRAVLVECKLRRHPPLRDPEKSRSAQLPSEEIYKVLGYFEQLRNDTPLAGVLVYYTPTGAGTLELTALPGDGPERLLLVGVDPAHADARGALSGVGDILLGLLGGTEAGREAREAAERADELGGDEVERSAAYRQQMLMRLLLDHAAQREQQLPAVEKLTRAWFPTTVWTALDADTRRMVLSAELYGSQELAALDHSGPLLVLCAACERELNLRGIRPVNERFPDSLDDGGAHVLGGHPTLGALIELLDRGRRIALARRAQDDSKADELVRGAYTPMQGIAVELIALWLEERQTELPALKRLLKQMRRLNADHRRPAAHDSVVEAETWATGRALVLGPEAILAQIVTVLPD